MCARGRSGARGEFGGGCERGGENQVVILAVGSFQKDVKVCVWCSGRPYPKYPAVQMGEGWHEDEEGETTGVARVALPAAGEAPSPVGGSFPLC